jgi:hypothetical protein
VPATPPPAAKVPAGITTKSLLATALTGFGSAIVNALAGGPTSDTITAATVAAAALITMAVSRTAQALVLHGLPGNIAKIVDRLLDEKLKQRP